MITIPNSHFNTFQKVLLANALEEALAYVCNNSPASFRGCQSCPMEYKSICRDLRKAADYIRPHVENSVENVENQNHRKKLRNS